MDCKPITSVFLHVTNACNARCRYCFEKARPDFMPYSVAKDTADWLIRNAEGHKYIPSINFFGGEPMLCWDSIIVPLTKYIREEYKKPFLLSMTSNCTLMTEKRLQFMQDNEIRLLFSVDGDRETQEYNRPLASGASSFDAISDLVGLIPSYFPGVIFRSTIIPDTCKYLFHNIQFAEQNGYQHVYVIPNVMESWSENAKTTVEQEMRKYSDYLIDRYRTGKPYIHFSEYDRAFTNIGKINAAIRKGDHRTEEMCGACAKCGLGTQRFAAVDYQGDIFGCQEMTTEDRNLFWIGNLYTGIDEQRRAALAGSYHKDEVRGDDCAKCRLNRICHGGCVANNYFCTGDVNHASPVYCWWVRLLLDEAIYICNAMGDVPPPMFLDYWRNIHDGGRN